MFGEAGTFKVVASRGVNLQLSKARRLARHCVGAEISRNEQCKCELAQSDRLTGLFLILHDLIPKCLAGLQPGEYVIAHVE